MSYAFNPIDPVPEEPEIEMEGGDGSETDVESGKCSDETLSFLRWKLKGDLPNTNPAREFYQRGAVRYCAAATCTLLPWMINFVLGFVAVVLAVRLNYQNAVIMAKSDAVPTDMMYSECIEHVRC